MSNTSNDLQELLTSLNADSDTDSIESTFKLVAKELFRNYHIQKGNQSYELLEVEFYFFSDNHKDIITYPRRSDKPGMWFFHMSGVDINFGNFNDEKSYGGILIRSMIRTDDNKHPTICGPMKCVEELYNYIDAIGSNANGDTPFLVKNCEGYKLLTKDFKMKWCQRFIPLRVKSGEDINKKINSRCAELNKKAKTNISLESFVEFLKKSYRCYLECDYETYWKNYRACPLESKIKENDNKYCVNDH